jgi:ABC-type phosphate transport system substrate-binding protein
MRHIRFTILVAFAFACLAVPVRRASAQIAVIVGRGTAVSSLSLEELRRIYSAKTVSLGGHRLTIGEYSKVRGAFYGALLKRTEDQARRSWVAAAFRGEGVLPTEFQDPTALKRWVNDHPGAIGFVDLASADATVTVLAIDGKRPTDAGYALK